MKLKHFFIGFLLLAVFFRIQNMTVESVLRGTVDLTIGVLNLLSGGTVAQSSNRQLPQGQGDSEEFIKPIEELEVIE